MSTEASEFSFMGNQLNTRGLERFFGDVLGTFWNQSGTAKMDRGALSVVDGKLRVYGVEGLRIADASIMPRVTTGNTMTPCVVIGEQAAAFLLKNSSHEELTESDVFSILSGDL